MKSTPQSSDEHLLEDARATWRAAIVRDEANGRAASEQRLLARDAPYRDRARPTLGGGRSMLVAFAFAVAAAVVIASLGRSRTAEIQADAPPAPVPASSGEVPVASNDGPLPAAPARAVVPVESPSSKAVRPHPTASTLTAPAPIAPAPTVAAPAPAPLPPLPPPAPPAPPPETRRPWPPMIVTPPGPRPTPPVDSARRAAESAAVDAERETIRKAGAELERGNVDKARELLGRTTRTASEGPAFAAALALAHTYREPTEQLAVWESVIPRLSGIHRAHAERERLRLLARLGRRPPTPTVAE